MKIMVVDDEKPIVDAVTYNLEKEGYLVTCAYDGGSCLDLYRQDRPDLILLDVMLPTSSGFDICRFIRRTDDIPIIMLTAKTEETDRVVGLELGADDYLPKPFSMRELIARVKSVLRRSYREPDKPTEMPIIAGPLVIDPARREVSLDGHAVSLSPKEFDLLRFLASHPDQVFSRDTLLDRVWGSDTYVDHRTVDVHIRWLRSKIEADASSPKFIRTVRGIGYKFSGW